MPTETMTPRERWLAVLQRRPVDRLPMDYWGTEEATQKVMAYLGAEDYDAMCHALHIDRLITVSPAYVGPSPPDGVDMYGRRFRTVRYETGEYRECIHHPLAQYRSVDEIKAHYTWPTADWFDFSVVPAQVEGLDDYPVRGGGSEPFLLYCQLRGLEQALIDLVINPEMVHFCLDELFEFCYQNTLRLYEAIPDRVNVSYVAEDMGSQESLLFSPRQIRTFLIPRMKRMIDLVHGAGAHVFFHSDGAVRRIVPDMIEAGIDVLNPIQWRCKGMEREGLKRDFGDQIVFHGGVDNQQTLPFGTIDDVREEVRANVEILGAGGGYIIGPCHNIQANTPPENVVAMYETGRDCGWS